MCRCALAFALAFGAALALAFAAFAFAFAFALALAVAFGAAWQGGSWQHQHPFEVPPRRIPRLGLSFCFGFCLGLGGGLTPKNRVGRRLESAIRVIE